MADSRAVTSISEAPGSRIPVPGSRSSFLGLQSPGTDHRPRITDHGCTMICPHARWVPSPNFSSRDGRKVDAIVLHHISLPPGRFGRGYVEAFFQNRLDPSAHPYFAGIACLAVSAHLFVDREGGVTQFVDTDEKAWHAGASALADEVDVNRFSVGIELEGAEFTPYTNAQYLALAALIIDVRAAHPAIRPERIVGHEHVAPGRKRDPGPLFDWSRLGLGIPLVG